MYKALSSVAHGLRHGDVPHKTSIEYSGRFLRLMARHEQELQRKTVCTSDPLPASAEHSEPYVFYQCTICDSTLSTARDLQDHVETTHEKFNSQTCEHCSKTFSSRAAVKNHVTSVHGPSSVHEAGVQEDLSFLYNNEQPIYTFLQPSVVPELGPCQLGEFRIT